MQSISEACRMLDAFTSVGAARFHVTFLDIDGNVRGFRRQQTARQIKNLLPLLFPGLTERRNSIVIRPYAREGVTLAQLDDLDAAMIERLKDIAFLTIQTSPGNHQAWVAVSGLADPKGFARRLRKAAGADISASGSVRLAGTLNHKRKYEPDFPTVSIVSAAPGRIVTQETLEALGLAAPPEPVKPAPPLRVSSFRDRRWPDYRRCLEGAPPNHGNTGPDISRADYFWCLMSAQRGFGIEDIAARLMELSSKARENGEHYARLTAENATAAAERGRRIG
jgi:RepB DNA-primase from phage plasmid